ncbi:MAG: hypothetical protein Q7T82_07915 [Armatimonadota bacterium]|nr:hypothetical protein [Armatimonadota bacterium]
MGRVLFAIVVPCLLIGGPTSPVRGVTAPAAGEKQTSAPQPDVQLLLAPTDSSGTAIAALTYSRVVATKEAQSDLESIVRQTRWPIGDRQMSINQESGPYRPAMSSVEFTAANALPNRTGTLPVEPLIIALKRHRSVSLIFAMTPAFQFHGPRDFENKYVRVRFRPSGRAYTYHVDIKNPGFTTLGLSTVAQPGQTPSGTGCGLSFLIPLILSAGVAVAVWLIVQTVRARRTA